MKFRIFSTSRLPLRLASAIAGMLAAHAASAANRYWDIDDATRGAGGAAPAGTWSAGGTTWSASSDGTAATPAATTAATDDLYFSAGTNATGAYTITLNDSQNAGSLTFEDGTVTVSGTGGGVINLGGTGVVNVPNSLTASLLSAAIGATTNTIISGSAGLTKLGVGTLTLNGSAANSFTGGLNINGGTLALDFANLATPTDLVNSGNSLTLGGGRLSIAGNATGITSQTLGNVAINSGGGGLLVNPNGGADTNITLGSLTTAVSGGGFVVGRATGSGAGNLNITTVTDKDATGIYGGRVVFADGTANTGYDWATTTTANPGPYLLSGYTGYSALDPTAGTDALNSRITAGATLSGSRTTNSLKFENPATAQTLDLVAGNTLTLSGGGLLFAGASVAQGPRISNGSITAGNGSGSYDLVIHQYNATAQNVGIGVTGTNMALISTISSSIVDNGANPVTLVKNGPGSTQLTGANTFTGGIIVNQGNIAFNISSINDNPMTFNANSIVSTSGAHTTSGGITLNDGSQVTIVNNNSSFTVNADIIGSGGMSAANGGQGAITLNLNGTANTFSGPVRFTHNNGSQAATINVASLADTNTFGSGNITFGAGTANSISHNFGLGGAAAAPLALTNRRFEMAADQVNQQINNASGQSLTISSDLLVTGSRGKNLVLGGAGAGISTFAGVIANHASPTAAGTIPIAVRTTAVVAAGSPLTLASVEGIVAGAPITGTSIAAGTTIATVNPFTRQVTLSAATTAGIPLGTNLTIPNVVNSVSVTKSGIGTWVLSGNNTHTGPTLVSAGALNIQHANALGSTVTGTLVANGAQLQLQGGISHAAEALRLTPGASGSQAMLRSVSGSNTWNGTITADSASAANVTRIQMDAGSDLTLAGAINATGSAHQIVFQMDGNATVTGQITGAGRVTSSSNGTGLRTLSNDTNNFTGSTTVNGGTIAFTSIDNVGAAGSALGAPTSVADATINLGAATTPGAMRYVGTAPGGHATDRVINLAGATGGATIEASGVGPLVLNAAANTATGADLKTLTLSGNNTGNNTIGGAVVDNSAVNTTALTKDGPGNWVLTGTNTYTGATNVNDGTLLVNSPGSISALSAVTVNGGTFGGSGTVNGPVTVGSAGNLAPGASAGTLTIAANLDISAMAGGAGKLRFELNSLAGTNDLITVSGTLALGTLALDDLDITNLGGLQAGTYALIASSGLTGTVDGSVAMIATGFNGQLQIAGNSLQLAVTSAGGNFASWATANGINGEAFGDDFDKDGISNGVEYALGLNPTTSSQPAGALSGNTITYTKGADALANDDVSWTIETSETLLPGSWTIAVTHPGTNNDPTISYSFTPGTPAKKFARLKAVLLP